VTLTSAPAAFPGQVDCVVRPLARRQVDIAEPSLASATVLITRANEGRTVSFTGFGTVAQPGAVELSCANADPALVSGAGPVALVAVPLGALFAQ
jgi:hypothetical protein